MPSRARPPSPELTNLDCAFPPFPTKASRSNTPVSDSRSQTSDNESSYVRAHAEPYNIPSRRGSTSSSGTRKRSKTLGEGQDAVPPPTTISRGRRPSLASITAGARPGFKNAPPLPSPLNSVASGQAENAAPSNGLAGRPVNLSSQSERDRVQSSSSPPKASKIGDVGSDALDRHLNKQRMPLANVSKNEQVQFPAFEDGARTSSNAIKPMQEPSNLVHQNDFPSYRMRRPPPIANTWLKEPEKGTVEKSQGSPSRSQTFPLVTATNPAVESANNAARRRPSEPSSTSSSWPLAPATHASSEKPPSQSMLPSTVSLSGRLYHSPSDSASSYGSVNSVEQTLSSRSSQPPHDAEHVKATDATSRHGLRGVQEPEILTLPKPPQLDYDADSPTDPAFQNGRLTPVEPFGPQRTQTTPELSAQPSPQPSPKHSAYPANVAEQDSKRDLLSRSKTTGANKGQCRGCSKIIAANQKSVSSADGRLTGRYHKECFACTTCHNAFQTADFYVLKDQPYCAQHYHTLNGSLCGSCGRGIEGQYLEATRSEAKGPEKFHMKCFTCVMCRVVLKHDYFAHHGRFFCERDIHRVASPPNRSPNGPGPATRAGPGGSSYLSPGTGMLRGKFPERRSTKLMIMS